MTHRGLDHDGVLRECVQDVHFCAFPFDVESLPQPMRGDCVEVMRLMEPESIDAIVCDPPYFLGFMNRGWDKERGWDGKALDSDGLPGTRGHGRLPGEDAAIKRANSRAGQQFHEAWATEALRILKPGAHLLAFGGTRTFHRLACGIEDAGFEIRDCLSWLYGSGFPKSLNIGYGRGTALKPAWEPCIVARKPLIGTVAANVAQYGTGAINIDACRIEANGRPHIESRAESSLNTYGDGLNGSRQIGTTTEGRWPANVALDEEAAAMLDAQSGEQRARGNVTPTKQAGAFWGNVNGESEGEAFYGDSGGASRFFYTAKASRSEREAWGRMTLAPERRTDGRKKERETGHLRTSERVNDHPTVKPLALMEWLIKLVTPDGGLILDPFAGSGSTLVAAKRLNVRALGIEQDKRSVEIARQRLSAQYEVRML